MDHPSGLRKIIAATLLVLTAPFAQAQSTFTLKYFGVTVHPFGDRTADLQPYKLDREAHVVLNFGVYAGYERFVYKDLVSIKAIQGGFTDCSGGWASVTHIGVRALLFENEKHRLYFGIGPTLLVRNSWTRFGSAYKPSGYFNLADNTFAGDVQWKFIPYGCEFEYDYRWTERDHLSVGFTPGVPLACTFSVGWKHWITVKEFDYMKLYLPKR
jgi:hypothetical protein